MVGNAGLRLPAQAQAERHVGMNLPVILRKESYIQHIDDSERVSGNKEKLARPVVQLVPPAASTSLGSGVAGTQLREGK